MKGEWSIDTIADTDDNSAKLTGKGTASAVFEGKARWQEPSRLGFEMTMTTAKSGVATTVEFYNWKTGKYEAAPFEPGTTRANYAAKANNVSSLIETGTKRVRARVTLKGKGAWGLTIDRAGWTANP